MSVKFFKNIYNNESIAINPNHVVSVSESIYVDPKTNEVTKMTNLFTVNGQTFQIDESFLEVCARLNEV